MENVVGSNYSKMNNARTSIGMDSTGIINNDRLEVIKSKVDILAREKQIKNTNNKIYYTLKQKQNPNNAR